MTNQYPEKEDFEALKKIDTFLDGAETILDLFEQTGFGSGHITKFRGRARLYLHTGGWSGCEEMLDYINKIWWLVHWVKQERGGHYVFEGPAK